MSVMQHFLLLISAITFLVVLYERDYEPLGVAKTLMNLNHLCESENGEIVFAVIKVIPMIILWLIIVQRNGLTCGFYNLFILAGLICSSVGDVLLVWQSYLFLHGMIAFGIAHLLYIFAFGVLPFNVFAMILSYAAGAGSFINLIPGLVGKNEKYYLPVLAYHCLIVTMVWRATARYFSQKNAPGSFWAMLGAYLFMVSDFVIGVNKFRYHIPHAHMIIMISYYLGQYLIALSTFKKTTGKSKKA